MNNNNFAGFGGLFEIQKGILSVMEKMQPLSSLMKLQKAAAPYSSYDFVAKFAALDSSLNTASIAMRMATQQSLIYDRLPKGALDIITRIDTHKNLFHNDFISNIHKLHEFVIPVPVFRSFDHSTFKTISGLTKNEAYIELDFIENVFEELSSINIGEIQNETAVKEYIKTVYEIIKEKITSLPLTKGSKAVKDFLLYFICMLDMCIRANQINELGDTNTSTEYLSCVLDSKIYRNASTKNRPIGEVTLGENITILKSNIKWMMIVFKKDDGESIVGWVLKNNFK